MISATYFTSYPDVSFFCRIHCIFHRFCLCRRIESVALLILSTKNGNVCRFPPHSQVTHALTWEKHRFCWCCVARSAHFGARKGVNHGLHALRTPPPSNMHDVAYNFYSIPLYVSPVVQSRLIWNDPTLIVCAHTLVDDLWLDAIDKKKSLHNKVEAETKKIAVKRVITPHIAWSLARKMVCLGFFRWRRRYFAHTPNFCRRLTCRRCAPQHVWAKKR